MKAVISPMTCTYKEVVRVATSNNFNCTDAEFKQLDGFAAANPSRYFFVNCNIKTPKLLALNKHSYKVVITINPELTVHESLIERLYEEVDPQLVAFVRVKYLPNTQPIVDLIHELNDAGYQVVITMQRFNGKASLLKYTALEHYEFSCSRYRLHGEALKNVHALADSLKNVHICDRKGLGCSGCGLCAKLTVGHDAVIKSLNMTTSGMCPYSCPDCYAKTMQHFVVSMGHDPISYDVIKQNDKQKGRSEHIKKAKAALNLQ
jgi:hypothetical protein